jgi:hypothetical protein
MTTTIYIRAREPENGRRLIDELLAQGIPRERLHVFGRQLPKGLPVEATRWQGTPMTVLPGAVIGAVVLAVVWLVLFPAASGPSLLLLALLGAVIGGLWSLRRERGKESPMDVQRASMGPREMMIAADLDDSRVPEIEQRIARDHPELLMLGPDASGSPPFP